MMFFYYRNKCKLAEYDIVAGDIEGFRRTLNVFGGVKLYRNNQIVDTTTGEGIIKNRALEGLRDFASASAKFLRINVPS